MAPFPIELRNKLLQDWVTRVEICETLEKKQGIKKMMQQQAQRMATPYVVERRDKWKQELVAYRLRPAKPGEVAGTVIEIQSVWGP